MFVVVTSCRDKSLKKKTNITFSRNNVHDDFDKKLKMISIRFKVLFNTFFGSSNLRLVPLDFVKFNEFTTNTGAIRKM